MLWPQRVQEFYALCISGSSTLLQDASANISSFEKHAMYAALQLTNSAPERVFIILLAIFRLLSPYKANPWHYCMSGAAGMRVSEVRRCHAT